MKFSLRETTRLRKELGPDVCRFLEYGLNGIERILPHVEVSWLYTKNGDWRYSTEPPIRRKVVWASKQRRKVNVTLEFRVGKDRYEIKGAVVRKSIPEGVGSVERTIDDRERKICDTVVRTVSSLLVEIATLDEESITGLIAGFDERVVSEVLLRRYNLGFSPGRIFGALHRLAGQTYENRPLTFGAIIATDRIWALDTRVDFPDQYFERKKYRALSDGYYTGYLLSLDGQVFGFVDLRATGPRASGTHFFPEWCQGLARASKRYGIGIGLTRNGDIVIVERGSLRFTHRFGQWNHAHLLDLLHATARGQRVDPKEVAGVVRPIYRASLDAAFRRSGALFIILGNVRKKPDIVRQGDAIGDTARSVLDSALDVALDTPVQLLPRSVLVELASLDGAVVIDKKGRILAYGAVLSPTKKGRTRTAEGSRTKAAIGASHYGMAIKVSSDGDITVYSKGREFITI